MTKKKKTSQHKKNLKNSGVICGGCTEWTGSLWWKDLWKRFILSLE